MPSVALQDATKSRRLELILRQVDSLPTLPAVATRLLTITADENADARQVIELVSSDQSLTAKVLSMVRAASRGVRDITTVDKAVVLLGFDEIRNAVLSIKVIEMFAPAQPAGNTPPMGHAGRGRLVAESETVEETTAGRYPPASAPTFNHTEFWLHALAVAVAAERIAAAHPGDKMLRPAEAFVCGLLHDIGKLALERVLPKSYERVIELVELNQGNIAEFERRVIGMDHHTAGKRLAEQWELPHLIQDCIWLHGQPWDTLPPLEHRRMIGLVTLADLIARSQHIGYSGNFNLRSNIQTLAQQLTLDPAKIEAATRDLHEVVAGRAAALGLNDSPSQASFLKAIQHANEMLGKLNGALARRSQIVARQQQVLEAIGAFHGTAAPGRSVEDVIAAVMASAAGVLGQGYYGIVYQPSQTQQWQINSYAFPGWHGQAAALSGLPVADREGWTATGKPPQTAAYPCHPVTNHTIDPPPGAPDLSTLDANHPAMLNQMGILPWLADYLGDSVDVRQVRLLPLGCGWGTAAVMIHDRPVLPAWQLLSALTSTWGAAIAAAAQHDGAKRLGEQLADANIALAETQDRLLRSESMARLGEMAAGAAHEMNNPLAVISGRSQLLAQSLSPGSPDQKAAQMIVEQSHRLSDLITSLRLYADPPKADRRATDIAALLDDTVKRIHQQIPKNLHAPINLQVRKDMPVVQVDGELLRQVVSELLTNALQALPRTGVHVNVRVEPARQSLIIQVADDGHGMDEHTLAHAMDPFFSNRPAGRSVGMGLPRAQQFAAAHHGKVELRSTPGEGTLATVTIPLETGE